MFHSPRLIVAASVCCLAGPALAEEKAADVVPDLLDLASGAVVLSATGEYDQATWSALSLIDGTTKTGWASREGETAGNEFVVELPYEARLQTFFVDTNHIDGAGRGARHFVLSGSASSPAEGFVALLEGEAGDATRTEFSIDGGAPVRWLKLSVTDNWGAGDYTEVMELAASGVRTSQPQPGSAPTSVAGVYDTNYNLMRIAQTGSSVEGCYDWDNGVLSGDTDGRVIRFEWREDGPQVGNAIMVLNEKADYLNGLWYENGALRGIWQGPRVTDGREPKCKTGVKNVVAETLGAGAAATLYGIRFEYDSTAFRPGSEATLEALFDALRDNPDWSIVIEGHTDSDGAQDYNLSLSTKRANAVKIWLADHGIDAARLTTIGKGESEPAADNATPQGRALNRRVVVRVAS